jgi:hypothetical protein
MGNDSHRYFFISNLNQLEIIRHSTASNTKKIIRLGVSVPYASYQETMEKTA